jgi:hypothetical protein
MATQIERRNSRQTALLSIPLCLEHPADEAVIVPGAGDRTIRRFVCEERLEEVRLSCRVSMSIAALAKRTDGSGGRVRGAPSHPAPGPTAATQSVQS